MNDIFFTIGGFLFVSLLIFIILLKMRRIIVDFVDTHITFRGGLRTAVIDVLLLFAFVFFVLLGAMFPPFFIVALVIFIYLLIRIARKSRHKRFERVVLYP